MCMCVCLSNSLFFRSISFHESPAGPKALLPAGQVVSRPGGGLVGGRRVAAGGGGSSRETLRSSVPGVVPQIHSGLVWPLEDSTRIVRSKGPGESAAKTEQCWTELSGKLQGSQECWSASYPKVTTRCGKAAPG